VAFREVTEGDLNPGAARDHVALAKITGETTRRGVRIRDSCSGTSVWVVMRAHRQHLLRRCSSAVVDAAFATEALRLADAPAHAFIAARCDDVVPDLPRPRADAAASWWRSGEPVR
jgi:hypothetical protein